MKQDTAHSSQWRTADIVFGFCLALGFTLDYLWPLSFLQLLQPDMLHLFGVPLLILCAAIIYLSKRELAREEQPSIPQAATMKIVKSGLFKYSRNPLYTGLVIGFIGLSIGTDTPWGLMLILPMMLATYYFLILPEERYLTAKFGDEYLRYKASVRRWL
ncbi:MAG: isoprenylcysteine carboxylmethyltransferase family protein [Gammaproteobacteria bacterium]|nr:isoprenylcysteine carboxylmethyltransferase family protein [Gammaproteobacteria bacterium]